MFDYEETDDIDAETLDAETATANYYTSHGVAFDSPEDY